MVLAKKFNLTITLLIIVLTFTMFPFSFVTAETQNEIGKMDVSKKIMDAKRFHVLEKLKTSHAKKKTSNFISSKKNQTDLLSTEISQEVTYSGKISSFQTHEYIFRIENSGKITVKANHAPTENYIDYAIVHMSDYGEVSIYENGDLLPAGKYSFVVYSGMPSSVSYNYTISGLTYSQLPDTTLPGLTISQPLDHQLRLAKGTSSFTVQGTTTDYTELTYNGIGPFSLSGSFQKTVPLQPGLNRISFFAIETSSGNTLYDDYEPTVLVLKRITGIDRFESSVNISKEMPPSSTVILTRGDRYEDALTTPTLAGLESAPILYTTGNSTLPTSVSTEIKRRQAKKVLILGNTSLIPSGIETQLRSLGVSQIERFNGMDQYETSTLVATYISNVLGESQTDTAIVATGTNFPDAVSAASISARTFMPILLVNNTVPVSVDHYLSTYSNIKKFIIVGGTGAVSTDIENKLKSYGVVDRISGADRYEVSVNIAKYFQTDSRFFVIARGDLHPESVTGGPFAASLSSMGATMLLTPPTTLKPVVDSYIASEQTRNDGFYILGGVGAVSTTIEQRLNQLLN